MRVLITGAQGFAGRYVAARWLAESADTEVIGLGRSGRDDDAFTHQISVRGERVSAPLPTALRDAARDPRYRYVSADILRRAELTAIFRNIVPDIIVHLASGLRDDPTEYLFRTNVLGTENLYHALAESGIRAPLIVLGSSGSVYGIVGDADLPVAETQSVAPFDMYSISKCAQESVARMLAGRLGIPTIIARIFAIVGPGQDERHLCGRLASQIADMEVAAQPAEMVVGPLTATRDFIDVRDTADAIVAMALRGEPGETYNVGSGRETPVHLIYDDLIGLARMAAPPTMKQAPARPMDMPRSVADISRLAALGVGPPIELRRSLLDVLDYYRECSPE